MPSGAHHPHPKSSGSVRRSGWSFGNASASSRFTSSQTQKKRWSWRWPSETLGFSNLQGVLHWQGKSVEPCQTHGPLGSFKLSWQGQLYSERWLAEKISTHSEALETNATSGQFMSLTAGSPARAEGNFSSSMFILVKKAHRNDLQ